jgi:hypothetical protein
MSGFPDDGTSAGMGVIAGAAETEGASARLKKRPVKFVKRKPRIIAKGTTFRERNKGNFRGNFIRYLLQIKNNDHKRPGLSDGQTSPLGAALISKSFSGGRIPRPRTLMGVRPHQLPFYKNFMTLSSCKYMYLIGSCKAVILMTSVIMTDKTGQWIGPVLTAAARGAYKRRGKTW